MNIDAPDLVRRIQDGDRSAEDELVRFYLPSLRLILHRRYSDPELVRDVVQDTFIAVIENLRSGKLQKPSALSAYVRSIAINKANEILRGERRTTAKSPDALDALRCTEDLLATLEQMDLAGLAREAIDALRRRDRELILLFYYYDMDKQVLCRQFDVTPAHFDRVKFRALKRLQALVEEKMKQRPPLSIVGMIFLLTDIRDG